MEPREWTDRELSKIEKRIRKVYRKAAREMGEKQKAALKRYAEGIKSLDIASDEWLREQVREMTRAGGLVDKLAASASKANRKAVEIANDSLPYIFSENTNMAAFGIDKVIRADTMFQLVDEQTVRELMQLGRDDVLIREVVENREQLQRGMERVQSIRKAEFDAAKDIRWNRQKFASAITQGILQGESIPNIVKRTDSIFNSNRKAAVRAARTAVTSAENAGRMRSFERAKRLGIPLKIEWIATLDGRTRDSHRKLDGQKVDVGEKFKTDLGEIEFPGDPTAHPGDVWNCRCTVGGDIEEGGDSTGRWSRLPDGMTYDEWKAGKKV